MASHCSAVLVTWVSAVSVRHLHQSTRDTTDQQAQIARMLKTALHGVEMQCSVYEQVGKIALHCMALYGIKLHQTADNAYDQVSARRDSGDAKEATLRLGHVPQYHTNTVPQH